MSRQVKKAVIPAAGLGTRFLPVTKSVSKELLPIVDAPSLQYIIQEAVDSGIEDILLIIRQGKEAISQYFSAAPELESHLLASGKQALYEKIQGLSSLARIHYIYQDAPRGLGHAISLAQDFAAGEPIAVLLGDDMVDSTVPCIGQLMQAHQQTGTSIVGVQPVATEHIHKYGIVAPEETTETRLCPVKTLVEKPTAEEAPSNLAIMGRYILTPDIFATLAQTPLGKGNELQLTDALNLLAQQETVHAFQFEGIRYDVGDQLGFVKANLAYALKRPELADGLIDYLKTLLASHS